MLKKKGRLPDALGGLKRAAEEPESSKVNIDSAGTDALLRAMQKVSNETVAALNRKDQQHPNFYHRCIINCPCGPCREGDCARCEYDRGTFMGRRRPPSYGSSYGYGRPIPEWAMREWVRIGGAVGPTGEPYLRSREEEQRWVNFQQYVERHEPDYRRYYRNRLQEEYSRYEPSQIIIEPNDLDAMFAFLKDEKKE